MKKLVCATVGACLSSVVIAGVAQAATSPAGVASPPAQTTSPLTQASVQAQANRSEITPVTVPAQLNTTSEYMDYGPACNDPSCAAILTVSESTSPIPADPAATTPTTTVSSNLRRAAFESVPSHRGDLLRRVFVHRLHPRALAQTASLPNDHLYTSASEHTGINILGVQFGVRENEYANFWTHGSLVPSIVNQQRSWWTQQPTCQPGSGISVGAVASTDSCSWWYSPATGATGMMSARDYWTASAVFKGFPISDGHSIFIHVTADGGVSDTFG